MKNKTRLRMYYPTVQFPSLERLPVCYNCGTSEDIPLSYIDIEVNPNEIDVELLKKTIESITKYIYADGDE